MNTTAPDPLTPTPSPSPSTAPPSKLAVAIVGAPDYGSATAALREAATALDGLGDIVSGHRVTMKVNLTGWGQEMLGLPAVETYIVHDRVIHALTALLLEYGARRVTIVESAPTADGLAAFATRLGWDVDSILRLGAVEFINTRSGNGVYASLPVPNGRLFDRFDVHPVYKETDVVVSVAKLKNHRTAGVTLALKNMFGCPPNSLYGTDAPNEDSQSIRMLIHDRRTSDHPLLPGELPVLGDRGPEVRVPRATVDICAARPIHLAVIDGIMTVAGGEGPWHEPNDDLRLLAPRFIVMGRDPVATDAVATAAMGYADPLVSGRPPFHFSENHIRIAHDAGLGIGDLQRIDVRGLSIASVRTPFAWTEE